jgi:hypothetical protein
MSLWCGDRSLATCDDGVSPHESTYSVSPVLVALIESSMVGSLL